MSGAAVAEPKQSQSAEAAARLAVAMHGLDEALAAERRRLKLDEPQRREARR